MCWAFPSNLMRSKRLNSMYLPGHEKLAVTSSGNPRPGTGCPWEMYISLDVTRRGGVEPKSQIVMFFVKVGKYGPPLEKEGV